MIYTQLTQKFWIIFNYSKKVFWGPFIYAQVGVSANTPPSPVSRRAGTFLFGMVIVAAGTWRRGLGLRSNSHNQNWLKRWD